MTDFAFFVLSLCAYGVFFAIFALYVYLTSGEKNNVASRERLCRLRVAGALISFLALAWCARHARSIFPDSNLSALLMPLAFVLAWAGYLLLDFLPVRALGGIAILLAHYHLYWIFALKGSFAPALSIVCYMTGILGMVLCGRPCLLRDFFRAAGGNGGFRTGSVVVLSIFALAYITAAVYYMV